MGTEFERVGNRLTPPVRGISPMGVGIHPSESDHDGGFHGSAPGTKWTHHTSGKETCGSDGSHGKEVVM